MTFEVDLCVSSPMQACILLLSVVSNDCVEVLFQWQKQWHIAAFSLQTYEQS